MQEQDFGFENHENFYRQPTRKELKEKAAKSKSKLRESDQRISSVIMPEKNRAPISGTWWGAAWCENIDNYAVIKNRVARGKSYIRSNAVIDLQIGEGEINALVQGSGEEPYRINIDTRVFDNEGKFELKRFCSTRIASLEALVSGEPPEELKNLFTSEKNSLFPAVEEMIFHCSCPDETTVCKHICAVLYGVGNRLDENPLLLFKLRGVDASELVKKAVDEKRISLLDKMSNTSDRIIDDDIGEIFGF